MIAALEPLQPLDAAAMPPVLAPSMLALYAAALVVLLAAAVTSAKPFLRLLRKPAVAAYVGAGWLWVVLGMLIGPSGMNVLSAGMIESLRPLILIALGWVGMTVGLQLAAPVVRVVPALVWRWAALDAAVCGSVAVIAVVAVAPHWMTIGSDGGAWLLTPIAILSATLIGWNPETRSMLVRATGDERVLARLVTGTSGLASVAAVLVIGVLTQFVVRSDSGVPVVSVPLGMAALGAAAGVAMCAAIGIRVLLPRDDWTSSRTLIVLISIASLAAGISAELTFSPLATTLLCGVGIANIPGKFRISVWRVLSRSERAISTSFFIIAGALLAAPGGGWAWVGVLVAACVAARLALKPIAMRAATGAPQLAHGRNRATLRALPARQSALAVVIAVAMVLAEDSLLRRDMLLVVVVTGMLCAAWPLVHRSRVLRATLASARRISEQRSRVNDAPDGVER